MRLRARHETGPLLADFERLAREQFRPMNASVLSAGPTNASRALIVLGPDASTEARSAAHHLRLQADVGLAEGPQASPLAIWPPGEGEPDLYHAESSGPLAAWLGARAVPALANTSEFEEDEPYAELGLPIARLFLNGSLADVAARTIVHDLAREFIGRISFLARNATSKAHEWRHHGLPAGRFPAFAVADSMAHNATRYAFLEHEMIEVNSTSQSSDVAFWSESAKELLRPFLEALLSRQLVASLPSEEPPTHELPNGTVKKLVGRTCRNVVETSESEMLIEVFDEWRRDHKNRTRHLDMLAPILAGKDITTYRLDLGYNECPPEILPLISAGYSGYFFVPRMLKQRKLHPERLKKLDPSFAAVLKFIAKHSEANLSKSIQAMQQELESVVGNIERLEYAQRVAEDWKQSSYLAATLIGLVGVLFFIGWRTSFKGLHSLIGLIGLRQGKVPATCEQNAMGEVAVS